MATEDGNNQWPKVWTKKSVRKAILHNDQENAEIAEPYQNQQVIVQINTMAKDAGLAQIPKIVNAQPKVECGQIYTDGGQAFLSAGGTFYIAIDPELSPRDAIAIASHEIGHLKNGDMSFATLTTLFTGSTLEHTECIVSGKVQKDDKVIYTDASIKTILAQEHRADESAIALCQGHQLADLLGRITSDKDSAEDSKHPKPSARVAALNAGAGQMEVSGQCPSGRTANHDALLAPFKKMHPGSGAEVTANDAPNAPIASQPAARTYGTAVER